MYMYNYIYIHIHIHIYIYILVYVLYATTHPLMNVGSRSDGYQQENANAC